MDDAKQLELLKRTFKAVGEDQDYLFVGTSNDILQPYFICNDLFFWACADVEEITFENIELLEKTYKEMADYDYAIQDSTRLLFCARSRKQRPQKPYYEYIPKEIWHLFDDCGPVEEQYMSDEFMEIHKELFNA